MYVERFFVKGLSHISYILGASTKCVVIDPRRDVDIYIEKAEEMGYEIEYILETHLHADFISGHLDLARKTGAKIIAPKSGNCKFDHWAVEEGDGFEMEHLKFEIIETPGHTPEHINYIVTDTSRGEDPIAIFTGDTLFVGDVGRPDLFPGMADELAEKLFNSLKKIMKLPDFTEVYPAHGAGSLCGKAISAKRSSTVGYERKYNPALAHDNLEDFKKFLLSGMPSAPDHFKRCSATNAEGPTLVGSLDEIIPLTPCDFDNMNKSGCLVLDVRDVAAFAGQHVPGSINIDINSNFTTFAGWILPVDKPLILVTQCPGELERAATGLRRVGLDRIKGWLKGGMYKWANKGLPLEYIPQKPVEELHKEFWKNDFNLIDVRSTKEYASGHISTAVNVPVEDTRTVELDRDKPVAVMCNSGHRSVLGASLLKSRGYKNVMNVPGGMTAWEEAGFKE